MNRLHILLTVMVVIVGATLFAAHGLGADPQDLGGFDYGRTAYGRRTVPIHGPILDH